MPEPEDRTVNEVRFRNHQSSDKTPPPGYEAMGDTFIKPEYRQFIEAAMNGELPDLGDVPEQDPQVAALAAELMVIHLPEWHSPTGRKLAKPSQMKIAGAVRVAEYLVKGRGVRVHPEEATQRWVPTPGANLGAGDPGKHIQRNPDGTWPENPDIEEFWDVSEIVCHQLPDGSWSAVHPRGIECTDASKTEAYAMCVERVRARVAELKGQS